MPGAIYTCEVVNGVICIEDYNGPKSVTNNIEDVLEDIERSGILLDGPIIYRDSNGVWGQILHTNGKFRGFGREFESKEEGIAAVLK
jgi:hypothetical protein